MTVKEKHYPIWDLPTRLFHWILVIACATAWITYELGEMEYHSWCGYTVLTLILFRIVWGFWGSVHSRFADFITHPKAAIHYMQGRLPVKAGHSPLGGAAVAAMLMIIFMQAVTGLFNSDEIFFDGPYFHAIDRELAGTLGALHETLFNVLLFLVVLHISAIAFYQLKLKKKLIVAMFTGYHPELSGASAPVALWKALLVIAISAGLVYLLLSNAPQPALSEYYF